MFDQTKRYFGLASTKKRGQVVAISDFRTTAELGRFTGTGRVSFDSPDDMFVSSLTNFQMFADDLFWKGYQLDPKAIEKLPLTTILDLLADVSPDVSRGVWDALLFCNPGWEADCFRPGTETKDPTAQKALDQFLNNLHGNYTENHQVPVEVPISNLFAGAYLRGGMFLELVLDADGRMPLEFATPDPQTIAFRKIFDPVRGRVWEMGQWRAGEFVVLDRPTIWYVPIHQLWKPKGRAVYGPTVFTTLFLMGLLMDLRRVVQHQGYPRLDLEINYEILLKSMPESEKKDPAKFKKWVEDIIEEIKTTYKNLEPDEAFIHASYVKINANVGTVDSKSLGAMDGIIKALERMSMRALKTMGVLFGINENTTETMANRQWEIHVAGIKAIQHFGEFILSAACKMALRVQGIQADVRWKFAELRNSELFRDAQVELLRTTNARAQYDNGSITADEMAFKSAGKDKAAVPEPRAPLQHQGGTGATTLATATATNPDPGSSRALQEELEMLFKTFTVERGVDGDFNEWWRERLGSPTTWHEAYEKLLARPLG